MDVAKAISSRSAYRIDDDVFITFNTVRQPLPPKSNKINEVSYPEEWYSGPQWFTDSYPYMPFSAKIQSWDGHIFGILKGSISTFPVEYMESAHRWRLSPGHQIQWKRLELALIGLCEAVFAMRPEVTQPMDFKVTRLPSSWGFCRSHETQEAARKRILKSRNAFVPLLALCAYAISTSQGSNMFPLEQRHHLSWITKIVIEHGVDIVWANEMAASQFLSPQTLRIGVYIDWEKFVYPFMLEIYIKYGVPVWVRIPYEKSQTNSIPVILRVPSTSIRRILMPQVQSVPQIRDFNQNWKPANIRNGQRRGENIHDFIQRRINENDRKRAVESDLDRQERVRREENASLFTCPKSLVFEWIEHQGQQLRTELHPQRIFDVWSSYSESQKWYNGFLDEWELCYDLAPVAALSDPDTYGNDEDSQTMHISPEQLSKLSHEVVQDTYPPELVAQENCPLVLPRHDILFRRYGLHHDGRTYDQPKKSLGDTRVFKILVEDDILVQNRDTANNFISYLLWDPANIPSTLHDLNSENTTPLARHGSRTFRFSILSDGVFSICNRETLEGRILVPYASQVTEVLRQSTCHTCRDLALYFATQGSAFFFGDINQSGTVSPFNVPENFSCGLGFRPDGFKPCPSDYNAYVMRRNDLLKDPSVIKAALMKGGIIWRLTIDSIFVNFGSVSVDRFFSDEVEDIVLTKQDLGVIIGLYLIWTGQSNIDKEASWWPQMHHWRNCGLDVNYWSSFCETWYTTRLEGIKNSNFQVRGAREWGQSLKFYKETKRLVDQNNAVSLRFLESLVAQGRDCID